jgi:hypothetical protein
VSIKKRLATIEKELGSDVSSLARLHLIQERSDLESELDSDVDQLDIASLEKSFIKVARAYGERKGITYSTWRTAGVSPQVLSQAKIARTRG